MRNLASASYQLKLPPWSSPVLNWLIPVSEKLVAVFPGVSGCAFETVMKQDMTASKTVLAVCLTIGSIWVSPDGKIEQTRIMECIQGPNSQRVL